VTIFSRDNKASLDNIGFTEKRRDITIYGDVLLHNGNKARLIRVHDPNKPNDQQYKYHILSIYPDGSVLTYCKHNTLTEAVAALVELYHDTIACVDDDLDYSDNFSALR
jgi:hypothetical protein